MFNVNPAIYLNLILFSRQNLDQQFNLDMFFILGVENERKYPVDLCKPIKYKNI